MRTRVMNAAVILFTCSTVLGAEAPAKPTEAQAAAKAALAKRVDPAIAKALTFLANSQSKDGGWKGQGLFAGSDPAITALAAHAFIEHPDFGPKHAIVQRAISFVLKYQQPDGGIYNPQTGFANYTTSIALTTLAAMKDPALKENVASAQKYLKSNQWDESKEDDKGKKVDTDNAWYGGAGYGTGKRPDLSNTQMMVEALHASGLPPTDPAFQKATKFISRCQMSSQTNDQPFARGAEDGGFIYSPASGGESKAGTVKTSSGNMLRSYGSMTYAGFKSMLYAGVDRNDPRVRTALDWIGRNYTLDSNPNMPGSQSKEGLFYYFRVFSKALAAWGDPMVVDTKGTKHNWREDLCNKLLSLQRKDGSWVNEKDRWYEGNTYLVTAYSVIALQTALR